MRWMRPILTCLVCLLYFGRDAIGEHLYPLAGCITKEWDALYQMDMNFFAGIMLLCFLLPITPAGPRWANYPLHVVAWGAIFDCFHRYAFGIYERTGFDHYILIACLLLGGITHTLCQQIIAAKLKDS